MPRLWRQGDVLPMAAALEIDSESDGTSRWLVCSHSCDLQEMQGQLLAIVRGYKAEPNGSMVGGKSVRYLQLESVSGDFIQFDVETLRFVDVEILDRHRPWQEEAHPSAVPMVLARWLAQKFDRLELPDEIVIALRSSGVEEALLKALKGAVHEILDVRVFVYEPEQPPSITFLLIYDAGCAGAQMAAQRVADAILARALLRAKDLEGKLVISGANAVSDTALTYAQWRKTRPFRAEYLSLRDHPPTHVPPR